MTFKFERIISIAWGLNSEKNWNSRKRDFQWLGINTNVIDSIGLSFGKWNAQKIMQQYIKKIVLVISDGLKNIFRYWIKKMKRYFSSSHNISF